MQLKLLIKNRDFRLLYIGQFVSFIGTMITSVALPYQIYHLTKSTLMVGLLSLVQLLPILFTALLGGVFADRYHRRQMLIIAESVLAIGCLLLAYNSHLASPSVMALFLISAIMSALNGLHRPALESITQQIVAKKDLPAVGSLAVFKYSVAMIAGPAIGGLIIAFFGITTTFLIDFSSFGISLFALLNMSSIPKPQAKKDESTLNALIDGCRYAMSRQELVGTYVIDFVAMIFGMPTALFPAIAEHLGGSKTLGLLYAAPAVGALIVSFTSKWTAKVRRHGLAVALSAALWGMAIIFFGLSINHLYLALFFMMLAGGFDAISGIFRSVMWNETIPQHYRGRLAGIEMISYLSGPKLGDTEAGLVAALFGITASVISGGVLCVAGVVVCCYFLPKFCRYQSAIDADKYEAAHSK